MSTQPTTSVETFPNPSPERDYTIRMTMPEFTCLCPKTGQPDFATLKLEYVPEQHCIELKSLNMRLTAEFYVRGGIYTTVVAQHQATGWKPPSEVTLP